VNVSWILSPWKRWIVIPVPLTRRRDPLELGLVRAAVMEAGDDLVADREQLTVSPYRALTNSYWRAAPRAACEGNIPGPPNSRARMDGH
jgi:hypothetical protein